MKVHLIKKQSVEEYVRKNAQSRIPLEEWLSKLKFADWEKPTDMQATFNSVDLLGKSSSRAVFDVGGNNYRVIGKYYFGDKQVPFLSAG